jgi:FemAB-related protein (PEP-CTERM system-associated)
MDSSSHASRHAELNAEKGRLSRLIGDARKSGQDFQPLLQQMQVVSAQLKALRDAPREAQPDTGGEPPTVAEMDAGLFSKRYDEALVPCTVALVEDESMAAEWDAFVAAQPAASIYHQWAFRRIVQQAFGHRAPYFVARDGQGKLCGVLPLVELKSRLFGHFWVSLPYFTYGGVVATHADIARALYAQAERKALECGAHHIEYRDTAVLPMDQAPVKTGKVSMVRALPDSAEQLWQDLGTKVRAQIKKADAFDLSIRFGAAELVDDFYTVFARNMRDLGTPVYAVAFFRTLMRSTLAEQFVIVVVYHRQQPVSCGFLMQHRDLVEIPWASTLRSANAMNCNMYLYWHVLSHAIARGARFFDFGRSSSDSPTWRFKKQWGAEPRQLYWRYWLAGGGELPELNPNNPKYRLLIRIWQHLPVWLTRLIGPPVVKYLP